MLWKYTMPYSGMIDGPASLSEARKLLIEKIKADPAAFISKMEPAEPTPTNMIELGKRVLGIH